MLWACSGNDVPRVSLSVLWILVTLAHVSRNSKPAYFVTAEAAATADNDDGIRNKRNEFRLEWKTLKPVVGV